MTFLLHRIASNLFDTGLLLWTVQPSQLRRRAADLSHIGPVDSTLSSDISNVTHLSWQSCQAASARKDTEFLTSAGRHF